MSEYPYVGVYNTDSTTERFSVLFTGRMTGNVIKSNNLSCPIGYHSDGWNEDAFTPSPIEILIGGELIKEDKGKENGKKD